MNWAKKGFFKYILPRLQVLHNEVHLFVTATVTFMGINFGNPINLKNWNPISLEINLILLTILYDVFQEKDLHFYF